MTSNDSNMFSEISLKKSGDTLSDGSIVIHKDGNRVRVLIAAPKETEVKCKWNSNFPEVFESLKNHGLIPSQWHIPTIEELRLVYLAAFLTNNVSFGTLYWASTKYGTLRYYLLYIAGYIFNGFKPLSFHCRAIRWVTL